MRVLIASGIFAPEAGGPATYAPQLGTELASRGHDVRALALSSREHYEADDAYLFSLHRILRRGRILNRLNFFFAALREIRGRDIIYTLDWFAVGFPVALAAKARGIPYVVRVGGDYLWEQKYLESGKLPLPLREFYERGLHRRWAYRPAFWMISFVLSRASLIVFNSDIQRELYERFYKLPSAKTTVVENPVPSFERTVRANASKEFVFWGRLIVMKNIETLLRAFAQARLPKEYTLALIGEGPQKSRLKGLAQSLDLSGRVRFEPGMPLDKVLERVKECRAFILPSWTDISPNQVYEALALGLPSLVTKENYLSIRDQLPETFDPSSVDELAQKLEMLTNDETYEDFSRRFNAISFEHDWKDVAEEHLALFAQVLGTGEMRVLQIGADRSKRGILFPDSPAAARQHAYAEVFGNLDIIGFSRKNEAKEYAEQNLHVYPTNSSSRFFYGRAAMQLASKLPRPSIVSVQDPFETGLAASHIARRFKAPLHVQIHTDFLSPEYARSSFLNRIRVFIAGYVLRHAARVRVVSERIKTELEKKYRLEAPITVLPVFVDIEKYKNSRSSPELAAKFSEFKTKLLVVARLEPEKNVKLALRAFATAAQQDACLVVVGDGSERSRLEKLANELNVSDRVFFEGEQQAALYYPLADLALVPSKYEGYGLVIVEALAAGKPVLSTDVGIAREAGAIVAAPEAFAAALKNWFERGPRQGALTDYPYKDFDDYVRAYCEDILACTKGK